MCMNKCFVRLSATLALTVDLCVFFTRALALCAQAFLLTTSLVLCVEACFPERTGAGKCV